MSINNREEEFLEGEDEAFIDLDDPNVEVVDEEDDEAEQLSSSSESDTDRVEEDGEEGETPQAEAEVEDLNAVPDVEPERDDAGASFVSPDRLPLHSITAHPKDPSLFATSGEGETIYIIRRMEDCFVVEQALKGHKDTISLLQFSPNGMYLASGSLDCTVCLWDTNTWSLLYEFSDLYGEIMSMLWHPSSLLLVAGADDAQIAMWNTQKGSLAMYFVGHRGPITCLRWTSDVKKLISGSSDGSVTVFSPKTGAAEVTVGKDLSPDAAGVTCLSTLGTDQCVVGCEDGTIHVISLQSGKVVTHLENVHEQAIESLEVNSNCTFLFTCGCDCKVAVWNAADFSLRSVIEVGEGVIPAKWVENHLIAGGCSDGVLRLWDGRSAETTPVREFMGHRRMILDLVVLEDSVVTSSDDGTVRSFGVDESIRCS